MQWCLIARNPHSANLCAIVQYRIRCHNKMLPAYLITPRIELPQSFLALFQINQRDEPGFRISEVEMSELRLPRHDTKCAMHNPLYRIAVESNSRSLCSELQLSEIPNPFVPNFTEVEVSELRFSRSGAEL